MKNGLEVHGRGYNLSLGDCLLSGVTLLSGVPYAKRHWELSQKTGSWGHRAIAVLEALPVIGGCAALIERIVISIYNKLVHPENQYLLIEE